MRFEVTILGSNAATFAFDRHVTAQLVNIREQLFLVDCGEGTQIRMQAFRLRASRIQRVFISHLHGDHVFGLAGLLTSFALNSRETPLTIYAPHGLEEMIRTQLRLTHSVLSFPIRFVTTNPAVSELLFENQYLTVHSIPLRHRIPAHGFLFREKPHARRLRRELLQHWGIPPSRAAAIKAGADYQTPDGTIIPHEELTSPPPRARSYAFCSDTAYHEPIAELIQEVDLLYHEATFLDQHQANARHTLHSTAREAALIAQKANAKKLLIGHFSARYDDLTPLLTEAQAVFPETDLAIEGRTFFVPYDPEYPSEIG